jgi:mono/diheme cytochrome c family protein
MKMLKFGLISAVVAAVGGAVFIYSGIFNIAADDPHWGVTYRVLELARNRSIAVRASNLVVPNLQDTKRISSGAGNYNSMCASCHLAPGMDETELSLGLNPTPPNYKLMTEFEPKAAFWAIKHGIKMTGMPAWGKSMQDEYIWGMVAFLQKLPAMSAMEYEEIIRTSPGHQHGGGETTQHGKHSVNASDRSAMAGMHDEKPTEATHERSSFEPPEDPMAQDEQTDHKH